MPERGSSPEGFRDQLLERLRNESRRTGAPVQRLQQRIAFERFLARLPADGSWVLKGGLALELRYELRSRQTRDIDLRVDTEPSTAIASLRNALNIDVADHFLFMITGTSTLEGAPGGTERVHVIARIAGIQLAAFHVDVSAGDALVGPAELLEGSELLAFAGYQPLRFPAYPIAQHLAEKPHAYSLPRANENTRVKDFVDLVLMAEREVVAGDRLLESMRGTFATRNSHPIPDTLPEPPTSWSAAYHRLASSFDGLMATELAAGFQLVRAFWQPVLDGTALSLVNQLFTTAGVMKVG